MLSTLQLPRNRDKTIEISLVEDSTFYLTSKEKVLLAQFQSTKKTFVPLRPLLESVKDGFFQGSDTDKFLVWNQVCKHSNGSFNRFVDITGELMKRFSEESKSRDALFLLLNKIYEHISINYDEKTLKTRLKKYRRFWTMALFNTSTRDEYAFLELLNHKVTIKNQRILWREFFKQEYLDAWHLVRIFLSCKKHYDGAEIIFKNHQDPLRPAEWKDTFTFFLTRENFRNDVHNKINITRFACLVHQCKQSPEGEDALIKLRLWIEASVDLKHLLRWLF